MTITATVAQDIASRFAALDQDEVDALHSDDGLIVGEVAVWHREDDNRVVAFTSPNHPDDGEEWAEVDVPTTSSKDKGIRVAGTVQNLKVTFYCRPAYKTEYSSGPAHYSIWIDGKWAASGTGNDAEELTDERALEIAEQVLVDRETYASRVAELRPFSAYLPRGQEPELPRVDVSQVTVGDIVWVFSRGNVRRGEVIKVGRKNITVEYVSSTGTISKKADSHVWLERRVDLNEV